MHNLTKEIQTQKCKICGYKKQLSEFPTSKNKKNGSYPPRRTCKKCYQDGRVPSRDTALMHYKRERREQIPDGMAYCGHCDNYKPPDEFPKGGQPESITKSKGVTEFYCKQCIKERYLLRRSVALIEMRRGHLARKFGIDEDEYESLMHAQGGVCAICSQPETKVSRGSVSALSVDHDHETGKIRGLLCSSCNVGLGYFRDDLELLSNAIDYLMQTHR